MSFPPGTEMFQFPGFASRNLCIQSHDTYRSDYSVRAKLEQSNRDRWVSPFGNLRVKGCSRLTAAYRSVPRPSSPVCAKASTNCPYLTLESPHHQQQRWALPYGKHQLGRATLSGYLGAGCIISARYCENASRHTSQTTSRSSAPRKSRHLAASISRTHSQCQRGAKCSNTARVTASGSRILHL
jgi:hypothetical protein